MIEEINLHRIKTIEIKSVALSYYVCLEINVTDIDNIKFRLNLFLDK
jgi:hypothetical protein